MMNVRPLESYMTASVEARRFTMSLLATFAAVALLLAAIGLYGVIAYLVGLRSHEIGVRIALGAARADVLRLVLGSGLRLAGAGVALGVVGALAATRLLASQLYGVGPGDPATFAVIAAVLALVALAASYVPARRAARVDPIVALRSD